MKHDVKTSIGTLERQEQAADTIVLPPRARAGVALVLPRKARAGVPMVLQRKGLLWVRPGVVTVLPQEALPQEALL